VKPAHTFAATILVGCMLAACAGPSGPRTPRDVIDRALGSAPYAAQPGEIVAREVEYQLAARERGQYTAMLDFAAGDAVVHGRNGPVPARPVFSSLEDPETTIEWSPRTVIMSCDGNLAVSSGRYREPEGFVGTFVTVWERDDRNDDYEWSYDVAGRDDPQPPPEVIDEDAIVVTAIDTIRGLVADCPRAGTTVPAPPVIEPAAGASHGQEVSPDGTLRWYWEHRADGTRYARGDFYTSGAWDTVIERSFASPPE
tara:strand:+ start:483 stop:1247 length:765 start_codon:yes stop_codon:yes gene_type:complete